MRVWAPPDGLPKAFCGECGGHLYSDGGERIGVRLGAVDGDPEVKPEWRQVARVGARLGADPGGWVAALRSRA